MDRSLIEKIKKGIEQFSVESESAVAIVGRVVRVGDGVAEVEGLQDVRVSERVVFEDTDTDLETALSKKNGTYGLVLNLEEEYVRVVILGDSSAVREGMKVTTTGDILSVPVGKSLLGRVVDALGRPLDGKGGLEEKEFCPLEREAYGVIDRQSVSTPLHTGIKAIDSMIPIGRGQRELIIGDRGSGKTTLAVDTILNQLNENPEDRPVCVYVAVGQKESKTARIVALLRATGAMEYTIVVDAPSSAPAVLQYLAPFAGAAVGEYFMDRGRDALIIYDDLSKQAVAYRELSLLLRRPPGREAYPGDIFYLHSRLLERAAKLSKKRGGGSLTALPIIETQEGDVSAYIPTNVISITDGQIYLDTGLFNRGVKPAINIGLSVSRVGSSAQTGAMKKVAGKIRLELAQFRELEAFVQFSQDLDPETRERISRGEHLTELLVQDKHLPLGFEKQVAVIYAGTRGFLEGVPLHRVQDFKHKLLMFLETQYGQWISDMRKERKLTEENEVALQKALEEFKATHSELYMETSGETSNVSVIGEQA